MIRRKNSLLDNCLHEYFPGTRNNQDNQEEEEEGEGSIRTSLVREAQQHNNLNNKKNKNKNKNNKSKSGKSKKKSKRKKKDLAPPPLSQSELITWSDKRLLYMEDKITLFGTCIHTHTYIQTR